jgi:DNA polymerase-3 subunit gamma/tau
VSYQVLARKWRPRNFQEVVGQQHVLTALSNGLAQNRVHHAYLFSGTRGVGKTTIARILAKSLNCEQGVTATPCGKCIHCKAIDEGRFVDLLEIDAASRTKVDDTRELLDNVQYKPAQGRYKVYLIDEVHMLSKHSFNALLKTLEEPPEYVKFLLATTDPQKLPITVLSRCLQFHLKAILPEQIEQQLNLILQHEQATFEKAALTVIAKAANGSMRDALSLTDQALAFGSGNIEYQAVLKMLGTIDNSHLYYLLHFIASGNVEKVFQKIEEFVSLGADFAKLHQELAALCHHIALLQIRIKGSSADKSAIQLLGDRLTPEEVQLYYQIAVQGYKDYAFAPNGKIAFEMTVMRLLAFKPANYIALDEKQLGSMPVIEQSQVVKNTVIPVEQIVSTSEQPAILPEANIVPSVDAISLPEHEQITSNLSIEKEKSPLQAEPVVTKVSINESNDIATEVVSSEPVDTVEKIQSITNSRNMLRSHRLKIEQAKKLQATTIQQSTETVVSDSYTAPVKVALTETVVANSSTAPVKVALTETVVADSSTAPVQVAPTETVVVDSHPTPVALIETFTSDANTVTVKTNTIAPFEQIKLENDIDSMAESSLPPDDFFPPIDSYLQDDFGEQEIDYPMDEEPLVQTLVQPEIIEPNSETDYQQEVTTVVLDSMPKEDKPSFFSDEQLEAPSIDIANYVADKLTDPWSLIIQKMDIKGLVKLLAKNCVMQHSQDNIILTLKAEQQHLLNNGKICEQLQNKLKNHFGDQVNMFIEVGDVEGQLTPIESEHVIYQQYLNNAKANIEKDPNIKSWVEDYDAKIYENTIKPL